jgi:hypothetical protein
VTNTAEGSSNVDFGCFSSTIGGLCDKPWILASTSAIAVTVRLARFARNAIIRGEGASEKVM